MASKQKRDYDDKPEEIIDENDGFENLREDHTEAEVQKIKYATMPPIEARAREDAEDFFGLRNKLNQYAAEWLSNSVKFRNEIQEIRERNNIPILKAEQDIYFLDSPSEEDIEEPYSSYWEKMSNDQKKDVFFSIKKLLEKYRLPSGFHDWLGDWILYNTRPDNDPPYNISLADDIFHNLDALKRIDLTTGEKNYIKFYRRKALGLGKGRPPKKHAKLFKEIDEILAKSKNKKRTFRSFKIAKRIQQALHPNQIIQEYDVLEDKNRERKATYKDAVAEVYPWANSEKDRKREIRSRKYVERLKKVKK